MKRIVKLHIDPKNTEKFIELFRQNRSKILAFEGCNYVELLETKSDDSTFFTYSLWDNELALNKYRDSELFKGIWKNTKALFNGKPEAWSVEEVV